MPSVLFVCTANICRSPIAMGLLRAKVDTNIKSWLIESAGTWADEGSPASRRAQEVLARRGIDLSDHCSRSVSSDLLCSFDLILTMEQSHKEALLAEFPETTGKIQMLSEMVGYKCDVRDPYGGTLEAYEETIREIEDYLNDGFEKIKDLVQR